MVVDYIYYPDHDERYAHILKGERKDYPDALKLSSGRIIPRVKTIAQLFKVVNKHGRRKYSSQEIWFHATDVPVSRAQKYANQF